MKDSNIQKLGELKQEIEKDEALKTGNILEVEGITDRLDRISLQLKAFHDDMLKFTAYIRNQDNQKQSGQCIIVSSNQKNENITNEIKIHGLNSIISNYVTDFRSYKEK